MSLRPLLLAGLVWVPLLGAGCGNEQTFLSQSEREINERYAKQNVRFDCPEKVDGGVGTEFNCAIKNTETGKSADVKMKVVKRNGDFNIDFADKAASDEVDKLAS